MSAIEELQLVYQCLCKGATDYLIKPVRQQQVQNLWQNVWRKRQEQKLLSMYEQEKGQKTQMVSLSLSFFHSIQKNISILCSLFGF
jgi:response regulator of citrate/malate metabolism